MAKWRYQFFYIFPYAGSFYENLAWKKLSKCYLTAHYVAYLQFASFCNSHVIDARD